MGYSLREEVSFCIAGARPIFLDRGCDRYFCLAASAETAFTALVSRRPLDVADREALDRLVETGFLACSDGDSVPVACWAPPANSSLWDRRERPGLRLLQASVGRLARAAIDVKARRLFVILQEIARLKTERRSFPLDRDLAALPAIVDGFRVSGRIVSSHDHCLVRSIAMARHLLATGLRSDLVFGVSVRPFAAHCWVQYGDVVVSDRLDHVRNFTPILVI
jgi:hypothetical protein